MKAYSAIAGNYEYLQKDYDYNLWSQYVIEKLSAVPNKTGVDVGAGTGLITRALSKAGFTVTGTDVSYEMLNYATSVTDGKIPFIYQKAFGVARIQINNTPHRMVYRKIYTRYGD